MTPRYGNGSMSNPARRVMILVAAGSAAIVALAGCSDVPQGVDGDLTDDWGGFSEPVGFAPDPLTCHDQPYRQAASLADYQPVECEQPHLVETVHVGAFTGEAAELAAPPAATSAEHRQAYRECEEHAADHLGAGFRLGRLWLGVSVPSEAGWQGGARWFRCELVEIESIYGDPVRRQGSLAGSLASDAPADLRLGCYQVTAEDGAVSEMNPVGCDAPHDAEFVGTWRGPAGGYPDPSDSDDEREVYQGCRERVAAYVDVPVDGDLVYRTGTIADWMSESEWQAGDRAFRCYLWLPGRELTESLAGAGTDALPVQTE